MKLRIENMTCGGCARSVTATIKQIDQQAEVDIDIETKLVNVSSSAEPQQILNALDEDGFPAQLV